MPTMHLSLTTKAGDKGHAKLTRYITFIFSDFSAEHNKAE